MLKRKSSNPSSNPNTPTYTICQKHCHNMYLKAYPKQFNEQLEVCTPSLPQTSQFCNSPLHHSKNHICLPREPSTPTQIWVALIRCGFSWTNPCFAHTSCSCTHLMSPTMPLNCLLDPQQDWIDFDSWSPTRANVSFCLFSFSHWH